MLVLLSYDCPIVRHQTFLRTEFMKLGGERIQFSVYIFRGEPHECDRVIRFMKRVAWNLPGDIRLLPMEDGVWERQIVISEIEATRERLAEMNRCVLFW